LLYPALFPPYFHTFCTGWINNDINTIQSLAHIGLATMTRYSYRQLAQSNSGSSLSELPPALFFLVFCAILPVVNMIGMGLTYCSCTLLNNLELREATRTPHSQLIPVFASIQQNWQSSLLGQVTGLTIPPATDVSYNNNNGADTYVTVSNVFTAKSFLTVPFFKGVPGLGAPWTYTIAGSRVLEDPSYASF
jgi:hypothetical protein